jgi:hypothetical protein
MATREYRGYSSGCDNWAHSHSERGIRQLFPGLPETLATVYWLQWGLLWRGQEPLVNKLNFVFFTHSVSELYWQRIYIYIYSNYCALGGRAEIYKLILCYSVYWQVSHSIFESFSGLKVFVDLFSYSRKVPGSHFTTFLHVSSLHLLSVIVYFFISYSFRFCAIFFLLSFSTYFLLILFHRLFDILIFPPSSSFQLLLILFPSSFTWLFVLVKFPRKTRPAT